MEAQMSTPEHENEKKMVASDAHVVEQRQNRTRCRDPKRNGGAGRDICRQEHVDKKVVMGGVRVMGCGHSGSGTGRNPNQEWRQGQKLSGEVSRPRWPRSHVKIVHPKRNGGANEKGCRDGRTCREVET